MTTALDPLAHGAVLLGHQSLRHLRAALDRDAGAQGAVYLQQAGFASGASVATLFGGWLAGEHGVHDAGALDAAAFDRIVSQFFTATGWGTLALVRIHPAVVALDSADWAEADPATRTEHPSCAFSCGMLAEFLSRVTGHPFAVLEVECRSRGDARCRFLAGAPESMAGLYERLAAGDGYAAALGLPTPA
ncbi:MAG: 4-vinyl reductase [Gemmatimonadales bacterium]|nr:4-vinyl reductase [Gemmatimonadales bacterium]